MTDTPNVLSVLSRHYHEPIFLAWCWGDVQRYHPKIWYFEKALLLFNVWYLTFNMFPFYLKCHIILWFLYWPAIAFGLCLFIPFSEIALYNPVPCFAACSAAWETRRAFYYNYTTCWSDSEDEPAEVCFQCCWEMSYFWYSWATPDSDQWDAWHNWWKCAITGLFSTICSSLQVL